jgi:hypothetical protein
MKIKYFSIAVVSVLLCNPVFSQNTEDPVSGKESKIKLKVTADIVSTYIWRGTVASLNPNIQPTLAIVAGGFEAGVWGSTDFSGSYKEFDPYITYTSRYFKLGISDYDWTFNNTSYFNYKSSETNHILEATIGFLGTEKVPLSITVNTMFYGSDKKWDEASEGFSTKQNYSTYVELAYAFGKTGLFLGVTPSNGYYGAGYGKVNGFAVCNLGITSTRTIKITPDFELPLKGTVYVNPQAESVHFVIGLTL